ncbi:class I SAM-dependent methyltransferase [Holzapfeliella floricola]|uniref:Adenine-specific methyltransferase n=1 Tax=Holzapfeliella floricola DSM 23037 = JCM 16512 TaxID=1423744 RepID=A0A0R2DSY5_9LACO|nr:class I SAM-dependent methyltransferase [Holzapfeliella floricola]KRN03530.1 adenine-specific methyltransferase [Holzapfeliella floricola DSM 23037 = JCM 16512]
MKLSIQERYALIDEAVQRLKKELKTSYLDALIETIENLIDQQVKVENGAPSSEVVGRLTEISDQVDFVNQSSKVKSELIYLLILAGIKEDKLDTNLQMTPKSISVVVAMIAHQLLQDKHSVKVLDLSNGFGSLLLNTVDQLKQTDQINFEVYGMDNNEVSLALSSLYAESLGIQAELFHQDSLDAWLINDLDMIVSELPVGYYPIDSRAENYELRAKSGHSFSHYLMLEQAISHLSEGGLGIFIVPAMMLQDANASELTKWLAKKAHIQAFLTLPEDSFNDEKYQKAILVVQNRGTKTKQANNILLGQLPSLNDRSVLETFNYNLKDWYIKNLK